MKSISSKPWMLPQPVLIIGTYDENNRENAMNAAWGGTWDMKEFMISLGSHVTTDNLDKNGGEFTMAFATAKTMNAADYLIAEVVNVLCDEQYLNEVGNPDVEKMNIICYEPVNHNYMQMGKVIGDVFARS